MPIDDKYQACLRFSDYLVNTVIDTARGTSISVTEKKPSGQFWLGRLCPEESVIEQGRDERGERLEPCATGIRVQIPKGLAQEVSITASAAIWAKDPEAGRWGKIRLPELKFKLAITGQPQRVIRGKEECRLAWQADDLSSTYLLELEVDIHDAGTSGHLEATFQLVNRSQKGPRRYPDLNVYETKLAITGIKYVPFELGLLPDSFRYGRLVPAYGINCGVRSTNDALATSDAEPAVQVRPLYWSVQEPAPDLSFSKLAENPLASLKALFDSYEKWHDGAWSRQAIENRSRAEEWSPEMLETALAELNDAVKERNQLANGIKTLETDRQVLTALCLMNEAMHLLGQRKGYAAWRPFQIAFIASRCMFLNDTQKESAFADVVWFATGGGKTETYLGLIIMAAFYDRLTGKGSGVTAWSRFPLRLLSLQQTQRFADAMAAAEVVRCRHGIEGDQFSVGYFVGSGATPNRLKEDPQPWEPDIEDDEMPGRFQVLMRCPFCGEESIEMRFNRRLWRLEHACAAEACDWYQKAIPFYIVDDDIYRYLPTVIVGTLDKAATVSMQAAMRGLVGPPHGLCSIEGHGYTYAPRSSRPNGCLVPGCRADAQPVDAHEFAPRLRLQDELHLLKDSLGAVDAHYEALYDGLSLELSGYLPKIVASSATLSGYEKQIDVLYRRRSRVFPMPPPVAGDGFWTARSDTTMRTYVPLAPRGVTLDYMIDNLVTILQRTIRNFAENGEKAAEELGIDPSLVDFLISMYGTDVVYGNTLRDLDAVSRSIETQINVPGAVHKASLTGRDDFEEIRATLDRLQNPDPEFEQRLHVITASSMMSHGVDIDRLNVMCMLGLPLTTAEFIQATARVGRTWPGVVFVAFKLGRERDAAMYRLFGKYVEHGDRFVEPIPITRKSRRVLDRTLPGLVLSRILMVHERAADRSLVLIPALREYLSEQQITPESEAEVVAKYLGIDGALDGALLSDLREWIELFFRNIEQPSAGTRFSGDCTPGFPPMRSLRDVEEQVPVHLALSQ